MTDKHFQVLTKIVGILFAFYGVLLCITALTVLFGTGVAGYAQTLAAKMGKSVGDFPYIYSVVGTALITVLSALYLVGSYALLKTKAWAYKVVGSVGVLGLLSGVYMLVIGVGFNFFDFFWGAVYLFLAKTMMTKKELFKN